MTPAELRADPWAFGPWCWVVDDVKLLPEPVPCRGMQGLWPVSAELRLRLFSATGVQVGHALTLLQPYASAIAIGPKRIENRPWRRVLPPGGLWIGLHAGKALFGGRPNVVGMLRIWRREGGWRPEAPDPTWLEAPQVDDLPLGAMLGAVHVAEILRYPEGT